MRPNLNSDASPVQVNLSGATYNSADLRFQYRTSQTSNATISEYWVGSDGTINTTFPKGVTNLDLNKNADFFQYRIQFVVNELETWIAPDLDSMKIIADHAGFTSNVPHTVNPLSEPVVFQTTHNSISQGEMVIEFGLCNSFGSLESEWSKLAFDGNSITENDTNNIIRSVSVYTNSSTESETILNWSVMFEDLQGASHICIKAATEGNTIVSHFYDQPIEIDNELELLINNIVGINDFNTTTGGSEISIVLDHYFPSPTPHLNQVISKPE